MHEIKITMILHKGLSWPLYSLQPLAEDAEIIIINENVKKVIHKINHCLDVLQLTYLYKPLAETVVCNTGEIIRDQCIEISAVHVDNILLDHNFVHNHSTYIAHYRDDFIDHCTKNKIVVNTEAHKSLKFWHSGIWTFNFQQDFWAWYSRQRNTLVDLPHDQIIKYFGHPNDDVSIQLNKLKNLLK